MAKENIQIQIDAAVKSAEAAQSLGQLRKSLLEIQTLQAQLGEESGPQFDKLSTAATSASQRLAETRDKIGDIQDKTRTLEGTPIERLTGSFGLLKDSVMNLDFDKAKIGLEGLTNAFTPVVDGKLVTGFAGIKGAMSGLMDGVKNLGSTFMSVGKALLTNPIFLLATAITLIVIGIIKLLDSLGLLKPMLDAIKKAIGFVVDMFEALTDWLGLTTHAQEENAAAAKANGETQRAEIDATAKRQQQHLKDIEGMTQDEIDEYKRKAKIKDDLNKTSFDIEKDRLLQTQETLATEINALNELEAAGGELTDEQKKDLEQRKKDYQANADAIVAIEEQKQKAIIDSNRKIADTLRSWQIKNIKDENDRAREQSKVQEAEDIRKINIEILNAGKLHGQKSQQVKDLEKTKLEIEKFYNTQRESINQAENKKAAAAAETALQKKLAEKEKEYQILILNLEKSRRAELSNANLTGDERLAINNKYDKLVLDQTKINEDKLFKFKTDNNIIKGNEETKQRLELNKVQEDRLLAFQQGQLKQFDEQRKASAELRVSNLEAALTKELRAEGLNANQRLEIQKGYDQQIFDAKVAAVKAAADAELNDLNKTEEEKAIIRNKAYIDIIALEDELAAKKQAYLIQEQEGITNSAQALVGKTEFDIEQYQRKYEKIASLDQQQIDNLIKLDMQEKVLLDEQMALELANIELTESEKSIIREKYRQLNIEQEQNAIERLRQARLKAAQDDADIARKGLQSVQNLTDMFFTFKKAKYDKDSKEGKKAAEQQFNTNKALQLGLAVIDGFKAVTTSLSQSPIAIGPVPNPAGIASLAFAITTSLANIAKIAASKFESPSSGPDAAAGGGSPGGIAAADAAAAGNVPTLSPNQFFGLGQTTPIGTNGNAPIKVYVTEGDITGVQERVAVIEERAILR